MQEKFSHVLEKTISEAFFPASFLKVDGNKEEKKGGRKHMFIHSHFYFSSSKIKDLKYLILNKNFKN
jgi:hypothetical protein